jgi:hypothetical protein
MVLENACWADGIKRGLAAVQWNSDPVLGPVVMPEKYRCGVKSAYFPSAQDICHCSDIEGDGVKTGFWHSIEVLSLPWQDDLWWPNSTAFKKAKLYVERELDRIYIENEFLFGRGYVRSVVMKMLKGDYELQHQTVQVNDNCTNLNETIAQDSDDASEEKAANADYTDHAKACNVSTNLTDNVLREHVMDQGKKRYIGAKGRWLHAENVFSTQVRVEHQFAGKFTVNEFGATDLLREHLRMVRPRDGQWLTADNRTLELWLGQGCYLAAGNEQPRCRVQGESGAFF